MKKKIIEFNAAQRAKKVPDLRTGDIIKLTRKIKEGSKEITQTFEGIVIAIKGKQSSSPMITVRKISHSVGVELIIPIYSPNVSKIELVKRAKVKRAKLYYIREKSAKSLKMKYKDLSEFAKIEPADAKVMSSEEGNEEKVQEEKKEEAEKK